MFLVTTSLSCLLTADGQILVVKIKIFPVKLEKKIDLYCLPGAERPGTSGAGRGGDG